MKYSDNEWVNRLIYCYFEKTEKNRNTKEKGKNLEVFFT